jgi:penicillin-binding protein 1C
MKNRVNLNLNKRNFLRILFTIVGGIGLITLIWVVWALHDLPDPSDLPAQANEPSIRIVDRNGKLLYEILSNAEVRHRSIPLDEIPETFQQAVIATEDKNFYTNPGVDPVGILRSVWINLSGGSTLAGGSTITQQVVKNLLFEPEERYERSMRRKLREAILAWKITNQYSKDDILALYLNQTDFGNLSIGVEAAAQTYFGKPASSLDLAECTLIAGLPQSPVGYDPFTDFEAAKERQQVVLDLMEKSGYITPEENSLAANEPLYLAAYSFPMEAPHFSLMVKGQLLELLPEETYHQAGGWTVYTTLDLNYQKQAEAAVQNQITRVGADSDAPLGHNLNNAAVVVLNPKDGAILAMVGSPDYTDSEHSGAINMALSARQPGSSLKPLIYAQSLDPNQEAPWTTGTMLLDVTTHFYTADGKAYTPVNYDGKEHGPVLMREALASSLNIPAVLALDHVGLDNFANYAADLGIHPWANVDKLDLSLALGGGEVSLLDLSAAYGVFANGGYRVEPYSIQRIEDSEGNVVYQQAEGAQERVMDERVAWLISDMLSDDDARYLGFGWNSVLQIERPAAVKTGTTTNFHDNWTVGYTPSLVVGVWAGNTDHEGMYDITGLTGAAPIWAQTIRSILMGEALEEFQRPEGLVLEKICAISGLLPGENCSQTKLEWFIEGTQPVETDDTYQLVELDSRFGTLADAGTADEFRVFAVAMDLPVEAENWGRANNVMLLSDLQREQNHSGTGEDVVKLVVTSPASGSVYHLAADVPLASQQIALSVSGSSMILAVEYYMDGQFVGGNTQMPFETWWQLQSGYHEMQVVAVLESGTRVESEKVHFEVK